MARRPTRGCKRSSGNTTPTTCSRATRTSPRAPAPDRWHCARRVGLRVPPGVARQDVAQLSPRRDAELSKRPPEVGLDGLLGDEQRLGDLPVGAAGGGELDYAAFAGSQRVGAITVGCPRPHPNRRELRSCAPLEGQRTAARGERQRLEQRL